MKATYQGRIVRGFLVLVKKGGRVLYYPCSGEPHFHGLAAIDCMERLTRRGISCQAYTERHGITETLTLDEMKEIIAL